MSQQPIGIFDSGIGGLSIVRPIVELLPNESIVYVADTAHCPYGQKPIPYLRERAERITRYLQSQHCKAIVVACNTATVASVAHLRAHYSCPIIGIEPAIRPAAAHTRSGTIGVLATAATLQSSHLAALIERYTEYDEVLTAACPDWVEAVEAGQVAGKETEQLVQRHVQPLLDAGADTLVLGCTHFPFLRPVIEAIAGPQVTVLETGAAVARQLQRQLLAHNLQCVGGQEVRPSYRFVSTADYQPQAAFVRTHWANVQQLESFTI